MIVNKAGSVRHSDEVVRALEATGIPVLGVLPRDAGIEAPSRHLGLVPVAERPEATAALDRLAGQIAEHVDLTQVLSIAYSAPPLVGTAWDPSRLPGFGPGNTGSSDRPVVAVAGGRAFTFRYAETTELLTAAGLRAGDLRPRHRRRAARRGRPGSTWGADSPRCTPPSWPATPP